MSTNQNENNKRNVNPNQNRYANNDADYLDEYQRQLREYDQLTNGRPVGTAQQGSDSDKIYYDEYGNLVDNRNAYNGYDDGYPQRTSQQGNQQRPAQRQQRPATQQRTQSSRQQGQPAQRSQPQRQSAPNRSRPSQQKARPTKQAQKQKQIKENNKAKNIKENFGKSYAPDKRADTKSKKGKNNDMEKKKHPVKRFFVILLVIILILAVLSQILIWRYIKMVNTVDTGTRNVTNASLKSDDVLNVLVIGSDTRDEDENGRTDSMILLSVNKTTKTTTMTSFMRDIYVTFPNYDGDEDGIDDTGKLNAANVYGGPELLLDTIEYNFDIAVDKYVYVDFYSFIDIVDAIGGIELDISDEEAEGMKAPMSEQNRILGKEKGTDYLSEGGTNLLVNGNQALSYARLRYVGNADFERTERQRTVITKILEKAKTLNPLELDEFAQTCLKSLTTNMTQSELYWLTYRVPFVLKYDTVQQRIPDDDNYTYGDHNGESTLDIDFSIAKKQLENIYK